MPGCRGASSGGRSGGGTVGARIRGLGVSGRGRGVLGDHTGVATRNTGPYIYIYIYTHVQTSIDMSSFPFGVDGETKERSPTDPRGGVLDGGGGALLLVRSLRSSRRSWWDGCGLGSVLLVVWLGDSVCLLWLKNKQQGLRRFWSMFPLTRVPFCLFWVGRWLGGLGWWVWWVFG